MFDGADDKAKGLITEQLIYPLVYVHNINLEGYFLLEAETVIGLMYGGSIRALYLLSIE